MSPEPGHVPESPPTAERWFTLGVGSVSVSSLLSDAGHEITTAVLPSFFTSVLRASAGALGIVEGISDALMGVAKLVGGPLADKPETRGRLASGGYLGTALATGAIGLVGAVWQAGVLRALAWVSRGIRGPSRDTLLSSLTPRSAYGRAFGLERAGDNLGAVAGPLLAAGLVSWLGIRPAMVLAVVPGIFAAMTITVAARQARGLTPGIASARRRLRLRALRGAGVVRPMVPIALFELGNVTTTILILRTTQLLHTGGRSFAAAASLAILVYAAHNAFGSVVAYGGGYVIDRAGPRVVFAAGAFVYVAAYVIFAINWHTWPMLLIAFTLAGSGIGLAETSESALVASMLPDHLRGSGFGLLGGIQSTGAFASSAAVGLLYAIVSPTVGFAYAAGWMLLSVLASGAIALPTPRPTSTT
ncbi:MAG: MFS transporter [Acidimicrobiales bacterium]